MRNENVISLFGNLLTNAFEAANKASTEKYVNVLISRVDTSLFLQIRNSHGGDFKQAGKHFLTTKHNKKEHGLGILIVKDIVAKYDGEIVFDSNEKDFIVEISFLSILAE